MAKKPTNAAEAEDAAPKVDMMNPEDEEPSELDDLTHREFITLYEEASNNVRFAKGQQWRTLVYFTALAAMVVTVAIMLKWGDKALIGFLFWLMWFFSAATIFSLAILQYWQTRELRKLAYLSSKFSNFSRAALLRKSRIMGDLHRYTFLILMMLYVELSTIAVSRMLWPRM